jgi:peptidoglycan glycosyltransferase
MVGFSENDKTPYAFAVVVEEGGSGYKAAGSIASELMQMLN